MKLRNLGNLQYFEGNKAGPPLPCCIDVKTAEERVKKTEVAVTGWNREMSCLCNKFSWVLFFSVPKLLKLYYLLCNEAEDHLQQVVYEISFLCENNAETRREMSESVKVCYLYNFLSSKAFCTECELITYSWPLLYPNFHASKFS